MKLDTRAINLTFEISQQIFSFIPHLLVMADTMQLNKESNKNPQWKRNFWDLVIDGKINIQMEPREIGFNYCVTQSSSILLYSKKSSGSMKARHFLTKWVVSALQGCFWYCWVQSCRCNLNKMIFILFTRLKKWGMESYLYAPKDDYKHRAYWRELYTVEEAEHLTGILKTFYVLCKQFLKYLSHGLS